VNDGFDDYVRDHWPRLVRAAVLLGCTPSEAEDVTPSALLRCLVHWGKVAGADDVDAYVHRVLINTFTSSRRRRWIGERPFAELPDAPLDDLTHTVDESDALMRALDALPRDQRAAVVLRHFSHLTEQQTATALGVPVGTVKSRMSRALKALAADPHIADLRGTR
jgi:RNA polymerase sigma-70 factor (sigma-E family)